MGQACFQSYVSVLPSAKLKLRRLRPADRVALARLADDEMVSRYFTSTFPSPYTLADADAWIEKHCAVAEPTQFAIEVSTETSKESAEAADKEMPGGMPEEMPGELAGCAGFEADAQNPKNAVLGCWLGRKFWGRGLATAVTGLLLDHAFKVMKLHLVSATVDSRNHASLRVLRKNGFSIQRILLKPEGPDIYLMQMLRETWLSRAAGSASARAEPQ